ncbi:MAG: glycoside hydrolase family 97 catalytic domain-containing protein [Planctomycetota bacterium]
MEDITMKRRSIWLAVALMVVTTAVCFGDMKSPDGDLHAELSVQGGKLHYSLRHGDTQVLDDSRLGITVDGQKLGSNVEDVEVSLAASARRTYPTGGEHSTASSRYREYSVTATRDGGPDLQMDFRLFNDGAAYRYHVPGSAEHTVKGEASAWNIAADASMWFQTGTKNYEDMAQKGSVGEVDADMGPPATLRMADGELYVAVTEAALLDYSGMTLDADDGSRVLRSEFLDDDAWDVPGGRATPWRVTIVVESLNALVNTDMLTTLSPAPAEALFPNGLNTEWIQPGRCVWRWWSRGTGNPSQERKFVDYASKLGFEYTLIDAGWEDWDNKWQTLRSIVEYAEKKGVDVWVWKNWSQIEKQPARRAFFHKVKDAGAVGVKIDYMNTESQDMVNFYTDCRRDAAREHLMVNFHGAFKPTGTTRTFPNEMTREGVRGLEYNKFNGLLPPHYYTTMPFARGVAGYSDFTPVTFNAKKLGDTTVSFQLASGVAFTSSVQHFGEHPSRLLERKKALDVIKKVAATWDETVVMEQSAIGELIVMARRKGDMWMLAVMNGSATKERTLEDLQLSFLGSGDYQAVMLSDASQTEFSRRTKSSVDRSTSIDVNLMPGGGFVAMFTPAD